MQGPVRVLGYEWNQNNADYPILSYRNTLYYPIGYHEMRMLGFETKWSKETGLAVSRMAGNAVDWTSEESQFQTLGQMVPVRKNRTAILLMGEKYVAPDPVPYLAFRGIRYLPLTKDVLSRLGLEVTQDESGIAIDVTRELQLKDSWSITHLVSSLNRLFSTEHPFVARITDLKTEKTVEYKGHKVISLQDGLLTFEHVWKDRKILIGSNEVRVERVSLRYDTAIKKELGLAIAYQPSGAPNRNYGPELAQHPIATLAQQLYHLESIKNPKRETRVEWISSERPLTVWRVTIPATQDAVGNLIEEKVYEVVTMYDPKVVGGSYIQSISFVVGNHRFNYSLNE